MVKYIKSHFQVLNINHFFRDVLLCFFEKTSASSDLSHLPHPQYNSVSPVPVLSCTEVVRGGTCYPSNCRWRHHPLHLKLLSCRSQKSGLKCTVLCIHDVVTGDLRMAEICDNNNYVDDPYYLGR